MNRKILIFSPSWGFGGSTLYLSQFVTYLEKNNYQVNCICRKKDYGSEYLKKLGATIYYSHFPLSISFTAAKKHENFNVFRLFKNLIKFLFGFKNKSYNSFNWRIYIISNIIICFFIKNEKYSIYSNRYLFK